MITTARTARGTGLRAAVLGCAALAAAAALLPAAARAATTPDGREWAAFGYYPPGHELVLFGGRRPGTVFGDTWTLAGGTWTQQHPASAPSARTGAAMTWDPASHQLVLFGGGASTGAGFSSQTWTWTGTTWAQLHPATSPPAREDTTLVYDGATRTVLLFAGWHGSYWDDTWSWNGTTWAQLHPAASPSGRDSDALAYDPATGQVILFGGFRGAGYQPGDTWSWNGTSWTQLHPAASPGTDVFAWQAADDPASGQVVLFGGDEGGNKFSNRTWTWTGTTWAPLAPAAAPPPRAYGTLAYDAADRRVVLFAGSENALKTFPTTTWSWTGTTWGPGS